jgi:putative oxidoreductase
MPLPQSLERGLLPFVARLFLAAIFVQGALGKIFGWSGQAQYMARHGMRFVQPLLGVALTIEALGVLCLVLGVKARAAAAIMCLYLLAVSVLLHNFWAVQDPAAAGNLQTHFLKNLAISGGLLMVAAYGPGRWAVQPSA